MEGGINAHWSRVGPPLVPTSLCSEANMKQYGASWADLENQFSRGNNQYPANLTGTFNLLLNFRPTPNTPNHRRGNQTPKSPQNRLTFVQNNAAVAGTTCATCVVHANIKCFNCNEEGHYASDSPEPNNQEGQLLQVSTRAPDCTSGFTFVQMSTPNYRFGQNHMNLIPDTWILFDSQPTVSVFKNRKLVQNIRDSSSPLKVRTNSRRRHRLESIR
jgi:hypothetical protein